MASRGPRPIVAALCGVLGILLMLAAVLLGYATRSVFNDRAFSERIAASLEDPRVANYVAERIADAAIRAKPDLVGLRPVLVGLARTVVASSPFRAAVRRSARTLHRAIMSGTGTEIVLGVQDLGAMLQSMAATQPALAQKIPPQLSAALGQIQSLPAGARAIRLVRFANRMRVATLALLLVGLALCAAGVWLSGDKRHAILRIGVWLTALGLLLAITARFGGAAVALFVHPAATGSALHGLAGAFLGGLILWGAGLGFAGLVLAAAAASLLERVPLQHWGERALAWLFGPQPRMRWRFVRGLLGVAVGAAVLWRPLPALTVLGWCAALVLAFAGLREAFVAALHLLPEIQAKAAQAGGAKHPASRWAVPVLSTVVAAMLVVTGWAVFRSASGPPEEQEITACNGSRLLCDRRLDQVVFPATHNSMGGADLPGWMFPNQSAGIPRQLEDGIRAFLIDLHYGTPYGDKVKTELDNEQNAMAKYESAVGKEGMDAALRIRDRLVGEKKGERDVYLCHGFCELGATRLVPVLREVREFLVRNPGEVLIFDLQDESVTPQDVERCFRESGLIDFVYRGSARPPWPTMRELVDTDQRVLVMAENHWQGVDWDHSTFEVMQETPYEFHDPSQFSNRPNRGGASGSLMLLNHWIETTPMPKPSNAQIVNAHDVLMARIRAFGRERGRFPNVVAVDFYGVGDLIPVVRELNAGIGAGPPRR